jgi:acyl carrier protein
VAAECPEDQPEVPTNEADARELVQTVHDGVAPGAVISNLAPDEDLCRTLDLDSLDFLNFCRGDKRTGLQTSESDSPKLTTLSGCLEYLSGHPAPA